MKSLEKRVESNTSVGLNISGTISKAFRHVNGITDNTISLLGHELDDVNVDSTNISKISEDDDIESDAKITNEKSNIMVQTEDNIKHVLSSVTPRIYGTSYVGISNIPNQFHRYYMDKTFDFNILTVGESGLGKSTLLNSLFLCQMYNDCDNDSLEADDIGFTNNQRHYPVKDMNISSRTFHLCEGGIKLRVAIIDTPGFGDCLDNSSLSNDILIYVENAFEEHMRIDNGSSFLFTPTFDQNYRDRRVHVCLYFLPPHVRGLRPIDISFMKKLHNKVNIVPIVARSDTLNPKERLYVKKCIASDIVRYGIKVFNGDPRNDGVFCLNSFNPSTIGINHDTTYYPAAETAIGLAATTNKLGGAINSFGIIKTCNINEDTLCGVDRFKAKIANTMPLCIVSSTNIITDSDGNEFFGRLYPWGVVDINDERVSDFALLRELLIRLGMYDLVVRTNQVLYEDYRHQRLMNLEAEFEASPVIDQINNEDFCGGQSFSKNLVSAQSFYKNASTASQFGYAGASASAAGGSVGTAVIESMTILNRKRKEFYDILKEKVAERERDIAEMEIKLKEQVGELQKVYENELADFEARLESFNRSRSAIGIQIPFQLDCF